MKNQTETIKKLETELEFFKVASIILLAKTKGETLTVFGCDETVGSIEDKIIRMMLNTGWNEDFVKQIFKTK